MMYEQDLTLLSEGEIWGNDKEEQLEVIKKYGKVCAITDLAILTGAYVSDYHIEEDKSLKGRTGWQWTKSDDGDNDVRVVDNYGHWDFSYRCIREGVVRPALQSSVIFDKISPNRVRGYNGTEEVEYGEYPQMVADASMQTTLENVYTSGRIIKTGRSYTFDSRKYKDYDYGFEAVTYEEYEYDGKKYIRVKANSDYDGNEFQLSNGEKYVDGDYVWVEVSPVVWLVDEKTKTLISKKGLVSGVRYLGKNIPYKGDFSKTEMKEFLDKHMSRDLFQTLTLDYDTSLTDEEREKIQREREEQLKRMNPYGFKFEQVTEEEIIKDAIKAGIAVFLHGQSSEGKSARVKQIDPECEIIYLRNATPDSLNGKSVYDSSTGQMIDIPPTWLKRLKEKCEREPDKLHIVFLDEITNALPSIQGMAFNIVLDREVNGIWKLPENARIVAAGNDMKDSLAANQLAEPLYNRFAHVFIKTTTESWLKWASENNIHPAIYTYIAYKKGETLRSKYDGIKPNADPRKWEMASKLLYTTGNPEMLRSLVGEDITREFVQFCKSKVITLNDVLNANYIDIRGLNTAEKYATTMGLSQVDEANLKVVRDFVISMGAEFGAIFDSLWVHGDELRLEKIAELRLEGMERGGMSR